MKWCRVSKQCFNAFHVSSSETCYGLEAAIVKYTCTLATDERQSDEVDELTLNSKRQSRLELREKKLEVVPAQTPTEHRHHAYEKQAYIKKKYKVIRINHKNRQM